MEGKTKLKQGWELLKNTAVEWWNDNTFRLAAALAFYTIFSVTPVLLIAVGAASLFFSRATAVDRVVAEIQRLIGEQGAGAIRQVLESSAGLGKGAWAITVGIVTLIFGATIVFAELQSDLNHIWGVKSEVRRGLILDLVLNRLRSFSIALGVGFLLLVSLVLSAALTGVQDYLMDWMPSLPWLWRAGNITISFFIVAILFAMIYKYLPDVQIEWRDVWIGALVTSVLFNGGKYLISIYLGHAAIGSAFGAAGSFAVLLVWIYYSALISFFGAEFTQVYARRHGRQIEPEGHARSVGKQSDDDNVSQ
jgi:membrane protein